MNRTILHIDMDAFFASIEQNDFPEYRGKPVIIGSDPKEGAGRGVVSTASYEARKYGIKSAMPISRAYFLCPKGIFLRPRMNRYSEISDEIFNIFLSFSPSVEMISVDEAFIDVTSSLNLFGGLDNLCGSIKTKIKKMTGLTCSIGAASNKSVAKIASELNKPNGLTVCPYGEEKEFLSALSVTYLWGAGKKTVERLNQFGIFQIGDLAGKKFGDIERLFGKSGVHLWHLANGIDDREVCSDYLGCKSISREITYDKDKDDIKAMRKTIIYLCDIVTRKLRNENLFSKTVSLKVRYSGFETITRSFTFDSHINDFDSINNKVQFIFDSILPLKGKIRLIGVSFSNLSDENNGIQMLLFNEKMSPANSGNKDYVLDEMKHKFGKKINRAVLLKPDID